MIRKKRENNLLFNQITKNHVLHWPYLDIKYRNVLKNSQHENIVSNSEKSAEFVYKYTELVWEREYPVIT